MPLPSFVVVVVVLNMLSLRILNFRHTLLPPPIKLILHFFNFPFSNFLLFAGEICGGHCCDNKTEADVLRKSIKTFEGLIKHQLKSLKGLWESTYSIYKGESEASICVLAEKRAIKFNGMFYGSAVGWEESVETENFTLSF